MMRHASSRSSAAAVSPAISRIPSYRAPGGTANGVATSCLLAAPTTATPQPSHRAPMTTVVSAVPERSATTVVASPHSSAQNAARISVPGATWDTLTVTRSPGSYDPAGLSATSGGGGAGSPNPVKAYAA